MILYNITTDLNDRRNIIIPTIPYSAPEDENRTIRRICLAPSVELCMQAMSPSYRPSKFGDKFILRVFDIPKMSNKELITPKELHDRGYVIDAIENKEYWVLKPMKCEAYLCEIKYYDYSFDIGWSCVDINRLKAIIHKHIPKAKLNKFVNSESLYKYISNYCLRHQLYEEIDSIWDEVAEQKSAQKTEFTNLKINILNKL